MSWNTNKEVEQMREDLITYKQSSKEFKRQRDQLFENIIDPVKKQLCIQIDEQIPEVVKQWFELAVKSTGEKDKLSKENKVLRKALEMACGLLHMDALDQCVECSENCDLCSPERYIKLAKKRLNILGD